jgi:hypothetical protein
MRLLCYICFYALIAFILWLADEQAEEADLEALDPTAQAALAGAWQGLLGTAVHLVHSLQAAQRDGSLFVSNSSSSAREAGEAPFTWSQLDAPAAGTAEGAKGPANTAAAAAAAAAVMQQRLAHLSSTLTSALLPDAAGVADGESSSNTDGISDAQAAAAAALAAIEALAKQSAAAGSGADALMRVLAGQGISLLNFDSESLLMGGSCSTVAQHRVSGTAAASTGYTAIDQQQQQQQQGGAGSPRRRRPSIAGRISIGTSNAEGTHSGNFTAFAGIAGAGDGSGSAANSSSDGVGFVACNVGPSSDGSTAAEGWSLAGNKPDAAGLAAAASVRAQAALWRESDAKEEAAASATTAAAAAAGGVRRASATGSSRRPSITGAGAIAAAAAAMAVSKLSTATDSDSPNQTAAATENEQQLGQALFVAAIQIHPSSSTEALQHMSALQAVLAEAAKLVQSWQQQRIVIAVLQQRLKAAAAQTHSGQQRLLAALQELKEIKDAQMQTRSTAAAASVEYQALLLQFQQAQQQLEQTQAVQDQLSGDNTQLQVSLEAALGAAVSATQKQQLLEQQLQQLQQQLAQEQAAKAAQQQQLDQTLVELERLRAEHANLQVQLSWYQRGSSTAAKYSACGC